MTELAMRAFKNPLSSTFKLITTMFVGVLTFMIAAGESAGRARAAQQLHSMGYHKEAKELMLRKD